MCFDRRWDGKIVSFYVFVSVVIIIDFETRALMHLFSDPFINLCSVLKVVSNGLWGFTCVVRPVGHH